MKAHGFSVPPSQTPFRVLVLDSNPLTRFAFCTIVRLHPALGLIADTGKVPEARCYCAEQQPEIVILDLAIPAGCGITLIREFRKLCPGVRVLAVSNVEDEIFLRRAFRAGAKGYVSKTDDPTELIAGLTELVLGRVFVSQSISKLAIGALAMSATDNLTDAVETLSNRELEIFQLLARGLGTSAIARELGVGVKTIETHELRMRNKLSANTTADLRSVAERWMKRRRNKRIDALSSVRQ